MNAKFTFGQNASDLESLVAHVIMYTEEMSYVSWQGFCFDRDVCTVLWQGLQARISPCQI